MRFARHKVLVTIICLGLLGAGVAARSTASFALPETSQLSAASGDDTNPAISYTTVFSKDTDGYNEFRIPSIVQTNDGTLLAFAEGRVDSPSDNGNIDVVMKTSNDEGKTWGPLHIIDSTGDGKWGNPVPIVNRQTGRIVLNTTHTGPDETLQTIECGQASAENTRRPFVQYSDDDGATWSTPVDITAEAKLPSWRHFVGGPGHGIQLQVGAHAGRMVIAGDHSIVPAAGVSCTDPSNFGGQDIYSDDGGTTWHIGGISDTDAVNPNESTAAELPDGSVYFNTRAGGDKPFGRADTTSHDGGATFDHEYQPITDIVTTQVSGSAVVKDNQGRERLVLSSPNHPTSRERMSLWSSLDNGKTWQQGPLIYAGPSSYSDLVQLDTKARPIGVLYENGPRVPSDSRVTYGQRITFARVPVGQLNSPPPKPVRTPDDGPNGLDANVSGQPTLVAGRFGNAFDLGGGDYVEVPKTDALDFGTGPFTVSAWFKTSNTRKQTIVWADSRSAPDWSIQLLATGVLRGSVSDGSKSVNTDAPGHYADGAWHQVTLVRSSSGVTEYVDGQQAATGAAVPGSVSEGTQGGIRFGARLDGINDPLFGDLDEAWVFDQALTADQVQQLYATNTGAAGATALHLRLENTNG